MANWGKCESAARNVLQRYAAAVSSYVDVLKIARMVGIKVQPMYFADEDQNISGFLQTEEGQLLPTIYINAAEDARRQTFTIAHELGHYFLAHQPNEWGINPRDAVYFDEKEDAEREADYFAAYLSMPKELVEKAQREYHLTDADYVILAEMFGVTNTAMRNRLKFLSKRNGDT